MLIIAGLNDCVVENSQTTNERENYYYSAYFKINKVHKTGNKGGDVLQLKIK